MKTDDFGEPICPKCGGAIRAVCTQIEHVAITIAWGDISLDWNDSDLIEYRIVKFCCWQCGAAIEATEPQAQPELTLADLKAFVQRLEKEASEKESGE